MYKNTKSQFFRSQILKIFVIPPTLQVLSLYVPGLLFHRNNQPIRSKCPTIAFTFETIQTTNFSDTFSVHTFKIENFHKPQSTAAHQQEEPLLLFKFSNKVRPLILFSRDSFLFEAFLICQKFII